MILQGSCTQFGKCWKHPLNMEDMIEWLSISLERGVIFKSLVFQKSRIFGPVDFQHPTFWAQCLLQNKPASRTLKWAEGFERNKKSSWETAVTAAVFWFHFLQLRFLSLWGFSFSKIVSAKFGAIAFVECRSYVDLFLAQRYRSTHFLGKSSASPDVEGFRNLFWPMIFLEKCGLVPMTIFWEIGTWTHFWGLWILEPLWKLTEKQQGETLPGSMTSMNLSKKTISDLDAWNTAPNTSM